jgi:biofilm PGA synthesis lipoprotein PgaB
MGIRGRKGLKAAASAVEGGAAALCGRVGITRRLLARAGAAGHMVALTYHRVGEPEPDHPMLRMLCGVGMAVTPEDFTRQMELIASEFTVVTLAEYLGGRTSGRLARDAVVLTFDDGLRETIVNVLPVLERYGFRGVFSLIGSHLAGQSLAPIFRLYGWLGRNGRADRLPRSEATRLRRLVISAGCDAAEIVDRVTGDSQDGAGAVRELFAGPAEAAMLAARGHTVAVHGWQHLMCTKLEPNALRDDLARSTQAIRDATGVAPDVFVYPYGIPGSFSRETGRQLAQQGFACAFTSAEGVNRQDTPVFELRRIKADPVRDDVLLLRMTGLRGYVRNPLLRLKMRAW